MNEMVQGAIQILDAVRLTKLYVNERSGLSLLALLNLEPSKTWAQSEGKLMGITPIIDWINEHYKKGYMPNTRETIRDETIKIFEKAGLIVRNPDDPTRPTNSPKNVYCVTPEFLTLCRNFGGDDFEKLLKDFLEKQPGLIEKYAEARNLARIPVKIDEKLTFSLSPGSHSELIKYIIKDFAEYFAPGTQLFYVGDTESKWGYCDEQRLSELGIEVLEAIQMPDVVLFDPLKDWLFLIESVTSNGPVDSRRKEELAELFKDSGKELIYVTAFPDKSVMRKFVADLAWETEVWLADNPTHMIHFNGDKFLGPHMKNE